MKRLTTRRDIRKAVTAALRLWRPITDTDRWEWLVRWKDSPESADGALAGVIVSPEYQQAILYVSLELLQQCDCTAKGLEYLIVHELCHLHLAAVAQVAEQHDSTKHVNDMTELATTKFAASLWRARYRSEPPPTVR